MKRSLILLTLSILLGVQVACTEKTQDYNSHGKTPRIETSEDAKENHSMIDVALRIENFRGSSLSELESFFEQYLSEDFIQEHASKKNPEHQRAITKFHLRFILDYRRFVDDRGEYAILALRYYKRLKKMCEGGFNDCPYIGYLARSIYAADVFTIAEPLIQSFEKNEFLLFITSIGHPERNPHILKKRLNEIVAKIKTDQKADQKLLDQLNNLVLFLFNTSQSVDLKVLVTLYDLAKLKNSPHRYRQSFESLLNLAIENKGDTAFADSLARDYAISQIQNGDVLSSLNQKLIPGLLKLKRSYSEYRIERDWKPLYILHGLVNPAKTGSLHKRVTQDYFSNTGKKADFLKMVDAYIFRKFHASVYFTHSVVGKRLQERIKQNEGSIERIIIDFFSDADLEVAEIWRNSYSVKIASLEQKLSTYFSSQELSKINNVIRKLEMNLRNMVGYPIYFIIGYHAAKQGNFNLPAITRNKAVIERDDSLYLHELFEGRFTQNFASIRAEKGSAQDVLLSFYMSLDKDILQYYGLDLNFPETFVVKYLEKENKFLNKEKTLVEQYFAPNGDYSELRKYCQMIESGNMNFSVNIPFSLGQHYFIKGNMFFTKAGGTYSGTSKEVSELLSFYNTEDIQLGTAEKLEFLRMELGPKILRLRIMEQALRAQGLKDQANKVKVAVDSIENSAKDFLKTLRKTYQESLKCLQTLNNLENDFRIHFLEMEMEYVRNTYWALKILNQIESPDSDIADVKKQFPKTFNMEYFADLPSKGSFIEALNERWLLIGNQFKQFIKGYQSEVIPQLGFHKENGEFVFKTALYEDKIRTLHLLHHSEKSGVDFPRRNITNPPRDRDELDKMTTVPKNKNTFYSWSLSNKNQTENQFVRQIFNHVHSGSNRPATLFEVVDMFAWLPILLNYATLMKADAYFSLIQEYDYQRYRDLQKSRSYKNFDWFWEVWSNYIQDANLSPSEKRFLRIIGEDTMQRADSITNYNLKSEFLLVYDTGQEQVDLGYFDTFFQALAAYQVGINPEFREELFTSPLGLGNPLIGAWIPKTSQIQSAMGAGSGDVIKSDDIIIRRSVFNFSKENSKTVKNWDQEVLFDIDQRSKTLIQHDLFHTVLADHALADAFISWFKDKELRGDPKVPYELDMVYTTDFHKNPDYLLPTTLQRYYESRNFFHKETYNLFQILNPVKNQAQ